MKSTGLCACPILLPLFTLVVAACEASEAGVDEANETWDKANNPAFIDATYEYAVDKLPVKGITARALIPGDYWPTSKDSINQRWDKDELSPAEKVEKALNKAGFAKAITAQYGIGAYSERPVCTSTGDECASLPDETECAIPRGESKGRCIPSWWGICHGWAPYAFSESAPVKPVRVNGVTFFPGDLEGLMSLMYSKNLPTKFISSRCDERSAERDADGRLTSSSCRDMNPGAMFVVLANKIGLRREALVEDRTRGHQVWNQPVRSFAVTNAVNGKLKVISKTDAVTLLRGAAGTESIYKNNPDAKSFRYVELEVRYITESSPSRQTRSSNLAAFTRVDALKLILELDARGRIVGGEWVGESREAHPDFMWWPSGKPAHSIAAMLSYSELRAIYDQAVEP
jgi:hypothetical protein